jgi:peptidoglycan/LPS O-acetylase OafA/YrhL
MNAPAAIEPVVLKRNESPLRFQVTCADVLSRENSIGFLRLVFALAVVFHHSFTLRLGWTHDPLWRWTGQVDIGTLAVGSFLVLSGFLISASFERSRNVLQFALNRFLRLYPGFWVCLLVSVLVLGPLAWLLHHRTFQGYWTAPEGPISYLFSNSSIFILQTDLAGCFSTHSSAKFNGSLWTLSLELLCYMTLPLLGLLSGFHRRRWIVLLFWLTGLLWYSHDAGLFSLFGQHIRMFSLLKVAMFFASGTVAYAFRDKIRLNTATATLSLGVVCAGGLLHALGLALFVALPVLLCWLAVHLPFRSWERRMDLSYGTYIYAYPLQQLGIAAWPSIPPLLLFVGASAVVLSLAVLSWDFVERPALRLKRRFKQP